MTLRKSGEQNVHNGSFTQYMQGVVLHSASLQPGQRPAAALPLTCQTRRYDDIPVLDADSSHGRSRPVRQAAKQID